MASPKQRAANRTNARNSTGPKSPDGKRKVSLNASKHCLSVPVHERLFAQQIQKISVLVRGDCDNDAQAYEISKRIIDFERNEAFLMSLNEAAYLDEIDARVEDPIRLKLLALIQDHRSNKSVAITFTTSSKRPKGKERTQEIKFIEDFIKLQDRMILSKIRTFKNSELSAYRYQKRAINQLVKGVCSIAQGLDF
jgi:hypothetical protein